MLEQYFKDIYKTYKTGDATEPSYYPDLKRLLVRFLRSKGIDPNITIQPRKTKAGIPDFTVRKGKELVGYVEAKDLSIEDLQTIEDTEQIQKYKKNLPNFILTNYFDFWLWRRDSLDDKKGQWIKKVRIGMPRILKLKTPPPPQNEKEFFELLQAFFSYYLPERKTAKALAKELASRTKLMPSYIIEELNNDIETEIDRIYEAFKKFLIHDLSKEDFADIYAQTITYGLFTARLRYDKKNFNRFLAQELIPKNIKILHDTFHLISHDKLTELLAWIIDDIATVLAHADIKNIRKELHREKGEDDPLMHFYETFLAEYDPKKRKARGVYYTPMPVVSYITRSIDIILKERFNKKQGFASDGVTLLDPASGTLTFPANAIRLAKEELDSSPNAGTWLQVVKDHILKDFYAFELLMAPYIIGHLKVSLLLEDLGYSLKNSDRFNLYLTNTLDFSKIKQSKMPFIAELSEEARKANRVKKDIPILVVIGNPPYSFSHSEQSEFVKITMRDYLMGLGVEKEKKKGVMQDDYIRFIRFAHWKIEQVGRGIVGLITNNSYLDGIIHRAMRKKILDDFDEIYILNLHGNSRLKEKTPQGGKDENVFDIQQGVGIAFFVKQSIDKSTITLDTNCINTKKEPELEQIEELERLGKVKIYISSVSERELRNYILNSSVKNKEKDLEVAVWDESECDNAVLGGENNNLEEIMQICFPEFPKQGKRDNLSSGQKRQLRDAMILEGHIRNKRDYFITKDEKGFIRDGKREKLKKRFGIKIYTPKDFLGLYNLRINYTDLWGLRKQKYKFLENHDITNTGWQKLEPKEHNYFFVPKDTKGQERYQKFTSVKDIFKEYNSGIQTKRDNLVIDYNKELLENKIRNFISSEFSESTIKKIFKLSEKGDVNLKDAQIKIKEHEPDILGKIFPYFYRPLDNRYLYFSDYLISRTRKPLSNYLLDSNNISLIVSRKLPINVDFRHAFVVDLIVDIHAIADQSYFFPLYLYDDKKAQRNIFNEGIERINLTSNIISLLEKTYDKKIVLNNITGEIFAIDIFYYIYAILYSNIYRTKYNEFLKIDFPRIPFTKNYKLFRQISNLGRRLADLHLLKSKNLEKPVAKFPISGDSKVEKREYKDNRIYIDDKQYFDGVKPEVWDYYIGGYQVLDKWLKDRIGKTLSREEVDHFLKVISAIEYTIKIQEGIDKIYPEIEKNLVSLLTPTISGS